MPRVGRHRRTGITSRSYRFGYTGRHNVKPKPFTPALSWGFASLLPAWGGVTRHR